MDSCVNLEGVNVAPKIVDCEGGTTESKYEFASNGLLFQRGKNSRRSDRIITKQGGCNFHPRNVPRQKMKFITDIFTTILDVKWRWTLSIFCLVYFGSWTTFAILWYLIAYFHGDIENFGDPSWKPCTSGIETFTSAFLFSVETQHTTGYGFYQLHETCSSAVFLFCAQSIVGVILEGMMVGLVFVKIQRAKKRSETIMFSRNAIIGVRDGILCFMFRVGDMRTSHLLETTVRAQLVKKRVTKEGELVTYHQKELEVAGEGERKNKLLLFWPTVVIHKINKQSPLWGLKEEDLSEFNDTFEIIVVLEGIVESTGLNVQARSSYLPKEIMWGYRFENVTSSKTSSGYRAMDYSMFHETVPVSLPLKCT